MTRLRYLGSAETDIVPSRGGSGHVHVRDYVVTLTAESVPKLNHLGDRLVVHPLCPFCEDAVPMDKTYLSKRSQRKQSEERYQCPSRHMIGLISDTGEDGKRGYFIGWR